MNEATDHSESDKTPDTPHDGRGSELGGAAGSVLQDLYQAAAKREEVAERTKDSGAQKEAALLLAAAHRIEGVDRIILMRKSLVFMLEEQRTLAMSLEFRLTELNKLIDALDTPNKTDQP